MQFMVLQICSFNCFHPQAYQPMWPVLCPLQIQPDFLQLLSCLFQQKKNPRQRLISLCSWFVIKLRINLSLSLFPVAPPRNNTECEIINILICFKIAMEEVEGSWNLSKSVSQHSEMTSSLIWGGSPRFYCFCLIFNQLLQLILMLIFWKSNSGRCCPRAEC